MHEKMHTMITFPASCVILSFSICSYHVRNVRAERGCAPAHHPAVQLVVVWQVPALQRIQHSLQAYLYIWVHTPKRGGKHFHFCTGSSHQQGLHLGHRHYLCLHCRATSGRCKAILCTASGTPAIQILQSTISSLLIAS